MSTTTVFGANAQLGLSGQNTLSIDQTGTINIVVGGVTISFAVGAVAPVVEGGGMLGGIFTLSGGAGLLNLADATNILKANTSGGPLIPMSGYLAATKKLRALYLENTDPTNTVLVTIPASNGLAGLDWVPSGIVTRLQVTPARAQWIFPAGSSVLTAGSTDGLVLTPSAGTPIVRIGAIFG